MRIILEQTEYRVRAEQRSTDGSLKPVEPPNIHGCLFLAEFLETQIGAQRFPDRIEPKQSRHNGH